MNFILSVEIWTLNVILVKSQGGKKTQSWRESLCLLREYINNQKQNVDRNMDLRAIRVRSQTEMRNTLLDSREKVIHVVTRVKKHD